ncbi:(2Fe-2S)-binding protein [Porticoccus sp.]
MYVCNCKAVTDRDIREAVENGVSNLRSLRKCTGATGQCGKCVTEAKAILQEALAEASFFNAMGTA